MCQINKAVSTNAMRLCALKILYKSDTDDVPEKADAPYQINLLKVLADISEEKA